MEGSGALPGGLGSECEEVVLVDRFTVVVVVGLPRGETSATGTGAECGGGAECGPCM